ncbi:hypothetical protein KRMM14A1259_71340 [Krasilnikovia sp. MM14-A1259]
MLTVAAGIVLLAGCEARATPEPIPSRTPSPSPTAEQFQQVALPHDCAAVFGRLTHRPAADLVLKANSVPDGVDGSSLLCMAGLPPGGPLTINVRFRLQVAWKDVVAVENTDEVKRKFLRGKADEWAEWLCHDPPQAIPGESRYTVGCQRSQPRAEFASRATVSEPGRMVGVEVDVSHQTAVTGKQARAAADAIAREVIEAGLAA